MTGAQYELALEARVSGAASEYRFRTADGVCSKDSFRPSELLLADVLWDEDVDRLRIRQANYGVVGVLLAETCECVEMTEASARAVDLCERNADRHGVDADVTLTAGLSTLARDSLDASTSVDAGDEPIGAVAHAPKPYTPLDVGAQRIADDVRRLPPGGRVYIAAAKHTGRSRYEAVLRELTTDVECVAERDGVRVLAATVDDSDTHAERLTYAPIREFDATVDGVDLSLVSVPGVFSATELDAGTRLLAETARVADGDRVLDLCCGYGPLGAYAAAVADCEVWLTDDDRVATACAERTAATNDVDARVVTADGVTGVDGTNFDCILCNPPTHATDRFLRDLFDETREVLERSGDLFVVFHRDLDLRSQLAAFDVVEQVAVGDEHVVVEAAQLSRTRQVLRAKFRQ